MLREYPEDWDSHMIEFHLNDSSHCLSTEVAELYRSDEAKPNSCNTCHRTKVKYLREANEDDKEHLAA